MSMSIKDDTIALFDWDLDYSSGTFWFGRMILLRLKILRAAECRCEDIEENDKNHHNPDADVDIFALVVAHGLWHFLDKEEDWRGHLEDDGEDQEAHHQGLVRRGQLVRSPELVHCGEQVGDVNGTLC